MYTENVDPLYKIFHAPSFRKELLNVAVHDLQEIDGDIETLLFAVYFAATVTLTNEEWMDKFKERKIVLLKRYRHALEQCLVRSKFLSAPRLITLQAFVLYLTTAQDAPISIPTDALLAIAVRSAISLGLHQDQARNQQQQFIAISTLADKTALELHRRLWWHLLSLDVQIAEAAGIDPMILDCTWDTQIPSNLNDTELDTHSTQPLPPRPGQPFNPNHNPPQTLLTNSTESENPRRKTDMTYILVRLEISLALRPLVFSKTTFCQINNYTYLSNPSSRLKHLDDLAKTLHEKYIHYCQHNDPLSFYIRNSTNLILSKHLTQSKRLQSPLSETVKNSAKILEAAVGLRKTLPKWAWSLRVYVELDVLLVLLQGLIEVHTKEVGRRESRDYSEISSVRQARLLAQAAVERGREHDLGVYYVELWNKIESSWKRLEDYN